GSAHPKCRGLHRLKPELWIGIEVYDQPIRRFDGAGAAAPAMELDRLDLGAGHDLVRTLDIQILLGPSVLLGHRLEAEKLLELLAGRWMLPVALKEAFALAAAEQVEQATVEKRKHDRPDDLVVERGRADADVGLL